MAKILNNNGERMNNEQVMLELAEIMPIQHKMVLTSAIHNLQGIEDPRTKFAHAVLDAYSKLDANTAEDERSKKSCLFLLNKYMKSSATPTQAEKDAAKKLVDTITGKQ